MSKEKRRMLKVLQSLSSPVLPKKRPTKESSLDSNWKKNPAYTTPIGTKSQSYVGVDCEMVSTENDTNSLARVSIVNMNGEVLLDMFVKPESKVINYRTFVTGIRPRHLNSAKSHPEVRKKVKEILKNKIVVGHALHHDLKALQIEIPKERTRDTQGLYGEMSGVGSVSLQKLCFQTLGRMIQVGHHSSVEDALATIEIFKTLFLAGKNKNIKKLKDKGKNKEGEQEEKFMNKSKEGKQEEKLMKRHKGNDQE